ncbi:MAG: hypothetical protein KME31_04875 [Tolypothrix carrinoi HA7290-LM1]|nr:hypothetical protein [Tolypothrix carrinoi HA7290-LM1]
MMHKLLTNWFFAILIGYRVPMTQSFALLFNRNCIPIAYPLLSSFVQVDNEERSHQIK